MDPITPNYKNITTVSTSKQPLLEVEGLEVHFPILRGLIFSRQVGNVRAVDGVSFAINPGETLGLVGESGCGKTTTGLAIMQLVRSTRGKMLFNGENLTEPERQGRQQSRRKVQMIFQDPYSSLNPRMTIGNIIADPIKVHGLFQGKALLERVRELLELVGLDPGLVNRYPHQFSGGQRQRVGVARALAVDPQLIICDEPVSALDVSIQAQILNLLHDLQRDLNLTYLFISHDLAVVRHISTNVAVMYLGKIAEVAHCDELYSNPLHPYTQALLRAIHVPNPQVERAHKRSPLGGDLPNPSHPPIGCNFSTRCPLANDTCRRIKPDLREIASGHWVACHLV
jgi:oligopeptide transport system ATP-binding protein